MRRLLSFSFAALVLGLVAAPDAAAQQSINLFIGGFVPQSLDARGTDDVIFQNSTFLSTFNRDRGIDVNKFNGATLGGEYLVGLGRNAEAGLGIGYYQRTVPVVYTDSVNANGSEIVQDLKLRIVPFSATVRFLPLGNDNGVQPYVGAGVGVFAWRYSETGEFIDIRNNIFVDSFKASGSATGPVVLGGLRFAMGAFGVGGEIRWQNAKADLPADQQFAGSRLSLGGFNYVFTMNFKF
jgi:outer membrane protein W